MISSILASRVKAARVLCESVSYIRIVFYVTMNTKHQKLNIDELLENGFSQEDVSLMVSKKNCMILHISACRSAVRGLSSVGISYAFLKFWNFTLARKSIYSRVF